MHAELTELYQRVAPNLRGETTFPGLNPPNIEPLADEVPRHLFDDVTTQSHPWTRRYTAQEFIDVINTQSNHRLLDPVTMATLSDGIRTVIADHGGVIDAPYDVFLVLARRH